MRKNISDVLDANCDSNMKHERSVPLSAERIKALTMCKINENTTPRSRHITFRVLITAAVIVALALSVFAANIGMTWFQEFFMDEYGTELSEKQFAFIEENAIHINQSKIVDGYLLCAESVMNDERTILVKLDLYAPEGEVLPYGDNRCFEAAALYGADGKQINDAWSIGETIDEDKTDNHVEFLIRLRIEQLMDADFLFTGSGATLEMKNLYKIDPFNDKKEVMAEGVWRFDLRFATDQEDLWQCELIGDPVPCTMVKYSTGEETEILITSVCLRAFTIDVVYDYPDGRDLESLYWWGMKVIKEDGTTVNVFPTDGSICPTDTQITGYMSFRTEVPIVLDEVAYVEFPGGAQIPVASKE